MTAKKTKKTLTVTIVVLAIILMGLLGLLFGLIKSNENLEPKDIVIETPYAELFFPGKWEDNLRVEQVAGTVHQVQFYGKIENRQELRLFDISFNKENNSGEYLGDIILSDGTGIPVNLEYYTLALPEEWSEDERKEVYYMQEDVNYLLSKLDLQINMTEPSEEITEEITATEQAVFDDILIETPYCTLYYPGQWQDYLQTRSTQEDGYTVEFYAVIGNYEKQLFTLSFLEEADAGDFWIQSSNGEKIAVVLNVLEIIYAADWTPEQTQTCMMMQEAVDDLLKKLPVVEEMPLEQEENPVEEETEPQTESTQPETVQDISVTTPYGSLVYPGKWKEFVRITNVDAQNHTYVFDCVIPEHDKMHLFSIRFGGNTAEAVGVVLSETGDEIPVCIELDMLTPGAEWSEEESTMLYTMQEDVNYIIDHLLP